MTQPDHQTLTLVCYDVAHNRRRRALSTMLEGFGIRVQESVFECWLTPSQRKLMLARANNILHPENDRLNCYTPSRHDLKDIHLIGKGNQLATNPGVIIV